MKAEAFIKLYNQDSLMQSVFKEILLPQAQTLHLKGFSGASDSVFLAALFTHQTSTLLAVLHDKEEAAYVQHDLKQLLPEASVLLYPTSYKKPYQYEETDNANVLQRAEVLDLLSKTEQPHLIISYPEALCEKVISKQTLVNNSFAAKVGDKLSLDFISELLFTYDFEKTDFVQEPGQFSVRGGILDVFSFANDLPYRLELFGDEIESIRLFNPETQLSTDTKSQLSIVPNIQTRLTQEIRTSFLSYLPKPGALFFKDLRQTKEVLERSYEKAEEAYARHTQNTGYSTLLSAPESFMETASEFEQQLQAFTCLEFGKQFYLKAGKTFEFNFKAQPSFNKEFKLLTEDLEEKQNAGFRTFIAADSHKQFDRLTTIFEELQGSIQFESLPLALREGFIDEQLKICCYTDHQIFERFHRYKSKERFSKSKALTLKELRTLQPGDFVTHADYGIARFAGLEKVENNGRLQEAIRLVFRDDDLLYISIHALHKISRYSGKEGGPPNISKLGSGEWDIKKKRVKKQVKDIAKELISLYAKRKAAPGFAYSRDSFLQAELESSFIYEDTPDQAKATTDVKNDMEQAHPMDRLVCGDVGFGKTEVAIRAAFKAVCDNKQVAVLVPTTVLAMQHYKTFRDRLRNLPCIVEYINRFKSAAQVKETLQRVKEGKTHILIGTHKLIGKEVQFKDLGLLVIDEEQKFGVKVKERLKEFKVNVDTLTLTATPIPRTLHFSLMGARDLSIIATPPPNRQPVTTELHVFSEALIRDAIAFELKRGGQVFVVHNRVADIEEFAGMVKRLVPDARIGVAHGQMEGEKLEKVMMGFVDADYDVLVSTNIIESGLDIPNANTIIIHHAHLFGLSDLHQMRGRVGRSNKKAYCYLLTPPLAHLPSDSRKRLSALEEFSDLGDGFKVAMRDLDIRGAGNLLGAEQSGFINDLGFDLYHKILDEAIQELKETEFRALFEQEIRQKELKALSPDCTIETDLSILIPDAYVSNITERLSLYSAIDNLQSPQELDMFRISLTDRFGPIPKEVEDLFDTLHLRWHAQRLGFEKLILKTEMLKGYFVPAENEEYYKSDVFGAILSYAQNHSKHARLKESNKKLLFTFDPVKSIQQANEILLEILERVPVQT